MNYPPEIPEEEAAKLKEQFPFLLQAIQKPEFGVGWLGLFKDMCVSLSMLNATLPEQERCYFTYTKEKFGKLTVGLGSAKRKFGCSNDQAIDILEEFGKKSLYICEYTGNAGTPHMLSSGWIKTLSEEKAKELGAGKFDWDEMFDPFKKIWEEAQVPKEG